MRITVTNFDDWQGIYVNGELKYENHRLNARDILEAIGAEYNYVELDMEELDIGRLPDTEEELMELMGEQG